MNRPVATSSFQSLCQRNSGVPFVKVRVRFMVFTRTIGQIPRASKDDTVSSLVGQAAGLIIWCAASRRGPTFTSVQP